MLSACSNKLVTATTLGQISQVIGRLITRTNWQAYILFFFFFPLRGLRERSSLAHTVCSSADCVVREESPSENLKKKKKKKSPWTTLTETISIFPSLCGCLDVLRARRRRCHVEKEFWLVLIRWHERAPGCLFPPAPSKNCFPEVFLLIHQRKCLCWDWFVLVYQQTVGFFVFIQFTIPLIFHQLWGLYLGWSFVAYASQIFCFLLFSPYSTRISMSSPSPLYFYSSKRCFHESHECYLC